MKKSNSVRTQLYIPKDMYTELKRRGEKRGKNLSQQVREALDQYLSTGKSVSEDRLSEIAGIASSGIGDLSEKHDSYLYGLND